MSMNPVARHPMAIIIQGTMRGLTELFSRVWSFQLNNPKPRQTTSPEIVR